MNRLVSISSVLCCCTLALAVLALPAKAASETGEWAKVVLPGAQQLDMRSAETGNRYRIFVSVPTTPTPATGYPVLYVLDGNAAFPVAAFLARSAANRQVVTRQIPPLVIGIGYPGEKDFDVEARQRDYTIGMNKASASHKDGGAEHFLDFIEKELKPMIAARYPVNSKRQALFGHSFGGLFVLHTLFTRPASFSTYLASSPSIWWRDKLVLRDFPRLMEPGNALRSRLQISVGSLEDQPRKGHYSPELMAMLAKRPMVSEARDLAARLKALPGWRDSVVYHELDGEDHGPAWLPAMTRGMQYFLEQP